MSSYATCSPHTSQTRLYRIRPPSSRCTWWKARSWLSVAVYIFTGTLTSPKETAPFHIARIVRAFLPPGRTEGRGEARPFALTP